MLLEGLYKIIILEKTKCIRQLYVSIGKHLRQAIYEVQNSLFISQFAVSNLRPKAGFNSRFIWAIGKGSTHDRNTYWSKGSHVK
jgi:hypothetical protein